MKEMWERREIREESENVKGRCRF